MLSAAEKEEREQLILRGAPEDTRWFRERARNERRSYGELLAVIRMELEMFYAMHKAVGDFRKGWTEMQGGR